eukprot:531972_1
MDILSVLWRGPRSKATESNEEVSLANCTLGITKVNERYANAAHPNVNKYFEQVISVYNKTMDSINSNHNWIYHLFRTGGSNIGDYVYKYGMWFIKFSNYIYTNKNILVEYEDLVNEKCPEKSIVKIENDEVVINVDNPNLTAAFAKILKENDSEFPPSMLSHLARGAVRSTQEDIIQQLYCYAKACPEWLNLYMSKAPILAQKRVFYLQKQFGDEEETCLHMSGFQQQSKSSPENKELELKKDITKMGEVYSGIMAMTDMITDENIDAIIAGIESKGIYNLSQMQNIVKHLKEKEWGFLSTEVDTIQQIDEVTYRRDLDFNGEKATLKNRKYFGELRYMNWLTPLTIVMFNYTTNILYNKYWIDAFLDFTEGNIRDFRNRKITQLICSMSSPLGGIVPYTGFETLCHSPNADTVETSFRILNQSQEAYTTKKRDKILFIHVDKFSGFLPGIYKGFGHRGHHFNYLLDCVRCLETMDYTMLEKYIFRIFQCGVHNMLGLGKHVSHNVSNMSKQQHYAHKGIMMELHRFINYSLTLHYMLGYYELLRYILTQKTFPLKQLTAETYKYSTTTDLFALIQKGMKMKKSDKYEEYKIIPPSENAKQMKFIKENMLPNWDSPPEEKEPEDENEILTKFLNDETIAKVENDDMICIRIFDKYTFIKLKYNKVEKQATFYPPALTPFTTEKDNVIQNNIHCVPQDMDYYDANYWKTVALTTHMIGGASVFPHNISGETVNREKKNQKKFGKKLTLSQYIAFTSSNKEKDRRTHFIRLKDQVARVAHQKIMAYNEDLEDEDTIVLKDRKNLPMGPDDEYKDLAESLDGFYKHSLCTGFSNCQTSILLMLKNEKLDKNGKELKKVWEKLNDREWRLITKLLKHHVIADISKPVANKLRIWLKQWQKKQKQKEKQIIKYIN